MNKNRVFGRGLSVAFMGLAALALAQIAEARNINIYGTPKTSVAPGAAYQFTPATTGDSGRRMRFTIANKPSWATFSKYNGRLSGTPSAKDAGTSSRVRITVTDGKTTDSLDPFILTVAKSSGGNGSGANTAPMLSGSPATTVNVGATYSFVPTATDANKDTLKFAITSKPTWATFDTATGRLAGVPSAAQAGSYEQISISVSDGKATTKLPTFAINVVKAQQELRTATLSWNPPTTNEDGTALTNLAGYTIHYGTTAGSYTKSVRIPNAGLTRYMIENLEAGHYYFVMVSVNSDGTESDVSSEVSVDLT